MGTDLPDDEEARAGGEPSNVFAMPTPPRRVEVLGFPGLVLVNVVPPGPHRNLFRCLVTEAEAFAYARSLHSSHGWLVVCWTPHGEIPA